MHTITAVKVVPVVCMLILSMLVALCATPSETQATVIYDDMNSPTASDYTSVDLIYGVVYPNLATDFLGRPYSAFPDTYAIMQNSIDDEWVATGLYNSPWYFTDDDPRYEDDLEPHWPNENASTTITIVQLRALACIELPGTRTFYMQYAINESKATIDAETAVWHSGETVWVNQQNVTNTYPMWSYFTIDVTLNESWNVSMLTNNVWVRLYSGDHAGPKLLVDYVGLFVMWEWSSESEGGGDPEGAWNLATDNMIGIMGALGLGGLVVSPAVAIWMHRRESGSSLRAFMMLLVTMTFCFFMFYASLAGG